MTTRAVMTENNPAKKKKKSMTHPLLKYFGAAL
jgi:hypothetical protein